MDLVALLNHCTELRASDLHLAPFEPPVVRIDGQLRRLPLKLSSSDLIAEALLDSVPPAKRARLAAGECCDIRMSLAQTACRTHLYWQQHGLAAAIRLLPTHPPALENLGLPAIAHNWVFAPHGLILICGATGSGKSSTLAALIHRMNLRRACHILTLEDPIEFQHRGHAALVTQRDISGRDGGMAGALHAALREDPDIIMVGEMRDRETVAMVLEAAQTGHLVLSTLHTQSTAEAIGRICGMFPAQAQTEIRVLLAQTLCAAMAQKLLPQATGSGRVLAHEVLCATHAVRNLIRENRLEQIESLLQSGRQFGMHTMQQCVDSLIAHGLIAPPSPG